MQGLCLRTATFVLTADGPRPMEQLAPGDLVLTRPELSIGKVFRTSEEELVHLRFRDRREETISTTPNHPFHVAAEGRFLEAGDLRVGDTIALVGGDTAEVIATDGESIPDGATLPTYNLMVEETHTYCVGGLRGWVHNVGRACRDVIDFMVHQVGNAGEEGATLARRLIDSLRSGRLDEALEGDARRLVEEILRDEENLAKHVGDIGRGLRRRGINPESTSLVPSKNARQRRSSPGSAVAGSSLPPVRGAWLRDGVGRYVPRSVADKLRRRRFREWDHFREELWKAVSAGPSLADQFGAANQALMAHAGRNSVQLIPAPLHGASAWGHIGTRHMGAAAAKRSRC